MTDKSKTSLESEKNFENNISSEAMKTDRTDKAAKSENDYSNDSENITENVANTDAAEELDNDNVSELKDSNKEQENYKDKYFYLAAETENMRRRYEREKTNLIKFGNEKILSSLIDVLDNLDRTIDAIKNEENEKIKNIFTGISMVQKSFYDVLEKNGLETVETNGQKFDPNFHEALSQQPSEDKEHHDILTEYQKGYILNGRLLRPSKVVIVNNE